MQLSLKIVVLMYGYLLFNSVLHNITRVMWFCIRRYCQSVLLHWSMVNW